MQNTVIDGLFSQSTYYRLRWNKRKKLMRIFKAAAFFVIALAVLGHFLSIAESNGYGLEYLQFVHQAKRLF